MEKKKFMRVQKFLILFLILLLSFPLSALAQQQMIKGQVVDDKGETIIGATVMVKGSKDGTLTDIDGNFSVKGKVGNTLVISYVGFTPLEIKVTKAEGNRFTLKEIERFGMIFSISHSKHLIKEVVGFLFSGTT